MTEQGAVKAKKLFKHAVHKTHMPFSDGKHLVFCQAGEPLQVDFECKGTIWAKLRNNPELTERFADLPRSRQAIFRAWKLHHVRLGQDNPQRLSTGLPERSIECSPAFFEESGVLHLSFIGGVFGSKGIVYHLFEMTGPSWDRMGSAKQVISRAASVGVITPRYICYGGGMRVVVRDRKTGEETRLTTPFARVNRVSFHCDAPEELIITGSLSDRTKHSILYNFDTEETREITSTTGSVYKPTIYDGVLIHAHRSSPPERSSPSALNIETFELLQEPLSLVSSDVRISKTSC